MDKTYIDKLTLILVRDRKLLMTKSYNKDAWLMPGGKRDKGESDEQALRREVREELGVGIVDGSIQPYGVFEAQAYGKPEGTIVRSTAYTAELDGEIHPSSEVEYIGWFNTQDDVLLSVTNKIILDDLKQKGLVD